MDNKCKVVYSGSEYELKLLLTEGFPIDRLDSNGRTMLMWSCYDDKYIKMTRTLVENGANTSILDNSGKSPLDIALENSSRKTVDYLTHIQKAKQR
jgi:ankyrin repeat protein